VPPRPSSQHRRQVHLLQAGSPVVDGLAGDDFQAGEQRLGERPTVALDESGDDVGASLPPALALGEHGVGLADARGRAQVDAEMTSRLDLTGDLCICFRRLAHAFADPLEPTPLSCSVISMALLYADRPRSGWADSMP
jgi:hypothetical protein